MMLCHIGHNIQLIQDYDNAMSYRTQDPMDTYRTMMMLSHIGHKIQLIQDYDDAMSYTTQDPIDTRLS